jgi:hypothetical protein
MYFFFAVSPVGLSVASVSLGGYAFDYAGVGSTSGMWGPGFLSVPIDRSFGVHTVDFTFVPPTAPQPLEIVIELLPGIEAMAFTGISLAAAPPHIDPGPVFDPGASG